MRKRDKEDLPIDPSSSLLSRNQADCSLSPFLLSAEEIHRGGIVGGFRGFVGISIYERGGGIRKNVFREGK